MSIYMLAVLLYSLLTVKTTDLSSELHGFANQVMEEVFMSNAHLEISGPPPVLPLSRCKGIICPRNHKNHQ